MRFISFILLILSISFANARDWKSVKGKGQWDIVGNTSPEEAKEMALFEAKKDAMRKAGVGTDVSSVTVTTVSSRGESGGDDFEQLNYLRMMAEVRVEGEPRFTLEMDGKIFVMRCEIDAKVATKEKNHDPNFKLDIQGIKTAYNSGDKMTFTIKPTQDCYVRIFWITDAINGKGDLLYPMTEYNSDIMLKANRAYRFPLGYADDPDGIEIDYTANAAEAQETNYMIVVGTKRRVAYVGEVDFRRVFEWMDGIDEGERTEWWVKGVGVMK